jgi:hypothetical protein
MKKLLLLQLYRAILVILFSVLLAIAAVFILEIKFELTQLSINFISIFLVAALLTPVVTGIVMAIGYFKNKISYHRSLFKMKEDKIAYA